VAEAVLALRTPEVLDPLFAQAGAEFGVPAELLKAVAYAEARWEMVQGAPEHEGQLTVHGLMGLKGPRLREAARLAGVSEEAASGEPRSNIRAAAALMASDARRLGIDAARLDAWAPVVARYSGIRAVEGQAAYVHHDVYAVLRQGAVALTPRGDTAVSLTPVAVEPRFTPPRDAGAAAPGGGAGPQTDYAFALWRPSPSRSERPATRGGVPSMIVIHTCEGGYTPCWSWLVDPAARASSHYVVREDGREVAQLVRERERAWHVGATYDCAHNGGQECWRNGSSVNNFSVGIEHAGYASQAAFPEAQLEASARLACDVSRRLAIPRDRFHVLGHAQLQPYNRGDPGPAWPWARYLARVQEHCSTGGLIVDSNDAYNDPSRARVQVGEGWAASDAEAGFYGSGYWSAPAAPVADGASFWFHLPEGGTHTLDAWWTAGEDRSARTPFVVLDGEGRRLGAVEADQRSGGARWNALGTWTFPRGWSRVVVSRWAADAAGAHAGRGVHGAREVREVRVVADAVRVR
jgi:hypothetical protein